LTSTKQKRAPKFSNTEHYYCTPNTVRSQETTLIQKENQHQTVQILRKITVR